MDTHTHTQSSASVCGPGTFLELSSIELRHKVTCPHLLGQVEALVSAAELLRLVVGLVPGHPSVHADLQGHSIAASGQRRWNYNKTVSLFLLSQSVKPTPAANFKMSNVRSPAADS